jgi:hypothetical protein
VSCEVGDTQLGLGPRSQQGRLCGPLVIRRIAEMAGIAAIRRSRDDAAAAKPATPLHGPYPLEHVAEQAQLPVGIGGADTALADPGKQFLPIAGLDLNFVGAVGDFVLLTIALALLHGSPRALSAQVRRLLLRWMFIVSGPMCCKKHHLGNAGCCCLLQYRVAVTPMYANPNSRTLASLKTAASRFLA